MATFTEQEIREGLQRLGELADAKGFQIRLTAVGGAVMVLAFGARQSTRDVDVVILSPREARTVRELAAQVADEFGWAPDWLNDGAKGYLRGFSEGSLLFSAPGIEVRAPSLEHLLAMKLSAWRDEVDISDARRILQEIARTRTRQEIWDAVEPYLIPGDELTAQYAFLDLWESLYGTD
jgi:predicted nucleotidyltransferase